MLVTDFIQFGIAMTGLVRGGAYYAAAAARRSAGSTALFARIDRVDAGAAARLRRLVGRRSPVFIIPLTVQWWSAWYPGSEPGGGSYIAQRMLAAEAERDALGGTLFFNVAHYALRPWPWIIVALASMLVFPTLDDIRARVALRRPALVGHDMAYSAMLTFLPHGVLGLMVAGLLAAYVSTISTHLNWGTSYLVHDLYRRFLKPDADERHYVTAGRLVTALLMVAAAALTFVLDIGARQLRPAAVDRRRHRPAVSAALVLVAHQRVERDRGDGQLVSSRRGHGARAAQRDGAVPAVHPCRHRRGNDRGVAGDDVAHCADDRETLRRFYERVRPAGPGWAPVRALCPGGARRRSHRRVHRKHRELRVCLQRSVRRRSPADGPRCRRSHRSGLDLAVSAAVTIRAIVRLWW